MPRAGWSVSLIIVLCAGCAGLSPRVNSGRNARPYSRDGYVTIHFTITPQGAVRDAKVIKSWPDHRDEQAALRKIRKWRLDSKEADGESKARAAVQTIYFGAHKATLRLINACKASRARAAADNQPPLKDSVQPHCEVQKTHDYAVYRWTPSYPQKACEKDISGFATVRFRLGAGGTAINPRVVQAKPPGVFNAPALAGIRHWHFLPLSANAPQPGQMMRQTFKFKAPPTDNVALATCGKRYNR